MAPYNVVLSPGDKRHGTNGYTNYGCRCSVCRTAWAEAQRELRLRRDPSTRPHGIESTYLNCRCRCDECKAEHARREGERRRRRARSKKMAEAVRLLEAEGFIIAGRQVES